MSIGIFGGSFNPVHLGHIALAREVQFRCHLDDLFFVPLGKAPHKTGAGLAPGEDRLQMLTGAVAAFEHFSVSAYEIDKNETSFSIDTVRYFKQTRAAQVPLIFMMGLDAYQEIETWKDYAELLDYCHLVVCSRSTIPWPADLLSNPISLTGELRIYKKHELLPEYVSETGSVFFLDIPELEISASDVRYRLGQNMPIDHLCPQSVCLYIQQRQLYKGRDR